MAEKKESVDTTQFRRIHKVEVKKKRFTLSKKSIAMIVVIVLIIAGCFTGYIITKNSDGYTTKVSGNKDVITGDVTVSKQGYFEYLLDQSGAQKTVDNAYNAITNKELPSKTYQSQIDEEVKKLEDSYKSYMGSVESYATSLGYKDVKTFREEFVTPTAKKTVLKNKYLKEQYNTILKNYTPAYIKTITVEKESIALKLIKQATSQEAFDKLMKDAAYSSNANDYKLVTSKTDTTTLNKRIKNKLSKFSSMKNDGVYPTVIKQSTKKYVVVYVYNTDKNKNKDTYINDLGSISDIDSDAEIFYLKKYKFTVYDKKLKKEIKAINKKYIND